MKDKWAFVLSQLVLFFIGVFFIVIGLGLLDYWFGVELKSWGDMFKMIIILMIFYIGLRTWSTD